MNTCMPCGRAPGLQNLNRCSTRSHYFENLYDWLETQHARGDNFNVTEQATKRLLHRYKLPFKAMNVPPKQNELFKWKKGAKRLNDWMVQGGFAPIDEGIRSLTPPTLVSPPPLQSQREARRDAMRQRVAGRGLEAVRFRGDGCNAAAVSPPPFAAPQQRCSSRSAPARSRALPR